VTDIVDGGFLTKAVIWILTKLKMMKYPNKVHIPPRGVPN